ncbi:MaoC family dehydratase [Brevundimonas faecalis]|uniref:MaoC-like domain-containing protein n=1 Tax=Brevundimonas faecalis TaxID=947378 RepID=A0ABV2RBM3_9CAUL
MTAAEVVERIDAPLSGAAVVGGALKSLLRGRPGEAVLPDRALQREAVLEASTVDAYGRLCGFTPDQGVPITWPHVLAFPLQMRILLGAHFPYPAIGLVHLHNRISQHHRLYPGDRLLLTARTGRFMAHDRGQAFTLETTSVRDGETVWEGVSLYLRLGGPGHGDPAPILTGGIVDQACGAWSVPADLGRRYAAASGDANPIHTSALGARLFGFRRPIAHGMWTKARAVAALSPQEPLETAQVEVAFRSPLFLPGQAALYAGQVHDAGADETRDFEVRDAAGTRTHLRGRLSVSPRPPITTSKDAVLC